MYVHASFYWNEKDGNKAININVLAREIGMYTVLDYFLSKTSTEVIKLYLKN